jgi:ribosomal protein L1
MAGCNHQRTQPGNDSAWQIATALTISKSRLRGRKKEQIFIEVNVGAASFKPEQLEESVDSSKQAVR